LLETQAGLFWSQNFKCGVPLPTCSVLKNNSGTLFIAAHSFPRIVLQENKQVVWNLVNWLSRKVNGSGTEQTE
jgi:hypothetical protein